MGRFFLMVLMVLTVVLASGCRFSVGHQKLMVRPGVGVPRRAFENGDGERVVCEGITPEGTSLFFFVGGRLQQSKEPLSRVEVLKKFEMEETGGGTR